MIKRMIAVLMTCLALVASANAGAPDIDKGISKYEWGDSASRHPGLSRLGDKGDVSYYSKPGETYAIGDVTIDKVVYGFYQNRLFGVYFNLDSIDVYDRLLAHLKSLYGLPAYKATADQLFVHKWKERNVIIKLKLNAPAEKMKLAFYFEPLSSKVNASQWEELDTSSFRFVPIEKDKKPEKLVLFEF